MSSISAFDSSSMFGSATLSFDSSAVKGSGEGMQGMGGMGGPEGKQGPPPPPPPADKAEGTSDSSSLLASVAEESGIGQNVNYTV